MEIHKLIPLLVLNFDFAFANPDHDWTVHNDWFVKQENFQVSVSRREGVAVNGKAY